MTRHGSDAKSGSEDRSSRPGGRERRRRRKGRPDAVLPESPDLPVKGSNTAEQAIRSRVLRAIALNRIPGLHFAGHFLDIQCLDITGETARFLVPDGPHGRDADGTANIVSLGVLADNVLATPTRAGRSSGARLGTVYLQLQFTGAPMIGDLSAESRLLGRSESTVRQKAFSSASFYAEGKPIAHGSGEFVLLDAPPGVTLAPRPWEQGASPREVPDEIGVLEPREQAILEACDNALAEATPQASFIQHFWGGLPRRLAWGAQSRVAIGPHIGNRVGHVQGGILFGLAAMCAGAAAPPATVLSNAAAWYISPGCGETLAVRSRVLHNGRTMSAVRTEIRAAGGVPVLEAVTQHILRKGD